MNTTLIKTNMGKTIKLQFIENSIYTFTDTMSSYSANNYPYNMTEYYGSDSNDESWATTYYGSGGYGSSSFHSFGIAFFEEKDDNSITWTYETGGSYNFNDSGTTKTFGTGESIYLAVRLPGDESKNVIVRKWRTKIMRKTININAH